MVRHVRLVVESELDFPVRSNHVGRAPCQADEGPPGFVGLQDRAVFVTDEGIRQVEDPAELVALRLGSSRDPDEVGLGLPERLERPTKLAGLLRSAGGEGLREEEDHHSPVLEYLVERALSHGEIGGNISTAQHGAWTIAFRDATRNSVS